MAAIERILVVKSYAEAMVLESRLEQAKIPCLLQAFNDPAFGSFWRDEEGWGLLLASVEYRTQIGEICEYIRSDKSGSNGCKR